jgi:hypothetical protein
LAAGISILSIEVGLLEASVIGYEFVIGGFSDIKTGGRDYGMGIVRIDPRFLTTNPAAASWPRHTLLLLRTAGKAKSKTLYAVLRTISPSDLPKDQPLPLLCLEYDDRLLLDLEKGDKVTLEISKAGIWGRYKYFRDHPNIIVRAYVRYAFMTGVFTAVLGAIAWALFRRFGL